MSKPGKRPEGAAKICALERDRKNPMRVSVWVAVSGKRTCVATVALSRSQELGLRVDLTWTAALESRVQHAAAQDAARDAALRKLGARAMSAAALEAALVRARHSPEAAQAAVQDLRQHGWLDDAAFAAQRAHELATRKGLARVAIADRLEAEGVTETHATAAARAATPASGAHSPRELLATEARAAKRKNISARTLAGKLARRGHDEDAIRAALSAAGYAIDE